MSKVYSELNVKELSGKNGLVIFFYPRAFAGPCSIEVAQFNQRLDDIEKLGFNVAGISIDDVETNEKFKKQEGLKYSLVSDPSQKITKSFGDLGTIHRDGKDLTVALRTTFILDTHGKTLAELKDVQPISSASTVIEKIKELTK